MSKIVHVFKIENKNIYINIYINHFPWLHKWLIWNIVYNNI